MDALEQLNLAAPIVDIYLEVESAIINHIARQLTANPDTMINATSEWRILMLARMGRLNKDTARIISSKVKKVPDKVQNVVNNAIDNILTEYGLEMTDKLSGNIFKALENYDRQAVKDKYNQVNTVMQYKAKQIYRNSVNAVADRFDRMMQEKLENSQEYLDVLNKQALAVTLGETSRTQALRETITEMSEKGIPAFVDASGREWSPEAYVNMDIRNTAKNAALAAEFASLDELGQDIILVSAHAGARPRCYPFQGKFYSRSGKSGTIKDARGREYKFEPFDKTSFGEAAGLFGINCGHRMRGVSDGTFINREEHYSEKENSEEYEKVCKQRQMERRIRADKRTQEALEAAGDTEGAKAVKKRIEAENKALRAYCDKEGLTYRQDRTQIYGYTDPKRKKKTGDFVETVDKSGGSGIIKNIELPANTSKIRSMSDETRNLISVAFDKINDDYKVALDELVTEPLGENNKNVPFQFQPIRGKNGELIKRIVINSEYDFMGSQEEFQKRIMRNFNNRILSSNSIDGLIAHEMAHVMTFQDVSTYFGFLLANKSVAKIEVLGISRYADASLDGAEHIAEAFAAKRCGLELSKEAQELIERYIERWKK